MREIITLQCNDCKNRNYTTTKNRKKHRARLETSKFCNTCRKHTDHKEVKGFGALRQVILRGVGSTVDHRSPKPRVGVRIPPPLPVSCGERVAAGGGGVLGATGGC